MGEFSRNQIGTLFRKLVGCRIWIPLDNWQFCLAWLRYSCSTQILCWSTTFQIGALVRYFPQSHNGWATWIIPPSFLYPVIQARSRLSSFKVTGPGKTGAVGNAAKSVTRLWILGGSLWPPSRSSPKIGTWDCGIMTRLCAAVAAWHSRHSHAAEQIRTVAVPLSILDASRPMGLFWLHEQPSAPVALVLIQQAVFFIIGKLLPRLWL